MRSVPPPHTNSTVTHTADMLSRATAICLCLLCAYGNGVACNKPLYSLKGIKIAIILKTTISNIQNVYDKKAILFIFSHNFTDCQLIYDIFPKENKKPKLNLLHNFFLPFWCVNFLLRRNLSIGCWTLIDLVSNISEIGNFTSPFQLRAIETWIFLRDYMWIRYLPECMYRVTKSPPNSVGWTGSEVSVWCQWCQKWLFECNSKYWRNFFSINKISFSDFNERKKSYENEIENCEMTGRTLANIETKNVIQRK